MQGPANLHTAVREITAPSCANCLDIHLGDYNLFLLEDYSGGHSVAGKVAAGGNITLDGFGVGEVLPDDNVSTTLVAGGNLHITNGNVFGATWYGGSYTPNPNWTVNFHRGTAAQGTPIDFAARFAELRSLSSRLATQPINGTTEPRWGNVYLTGTDPCLNVFEVNASDFNSALGRTISVPAGSFVLVNIRGTGPTLSGGFTDGINPQRVLYNFVDATGLDARGFGLVGTVLAPHAHVTLNDGSWSGGIYAVSLSGNATGYLSPLDDMGGANAEVCNEVDDDCNGQVDEGFECTGSSNRSCTAWCGATGAQTCNPATCGYGECTSASCCRADADCGDGSYCEATLCTAKKGNGASCSSANPCASGQCVDGVCCNTACEGECDACNQVGHVGTCSMAPSTVQCRASGGECDVAEYCTGVSASCPTNGSQASGAACTSDSNACTSDVCDGSGSCSHPLLPAGTSCGSGQICTATGQCASACWIEGTNYAAGATNPSGACQVCNPSQSTSSWSFIADGTSCGTSHGTWGSCGGFSDVCDTTGTQSRTVTASTCGSGTCSPSSSSMETQACTRSTAGVECRAGGVCNFAEYCSGGTCPADAKMPAGTSCNDGNASTTGDTCDGAGACTGCGDGVRNGTEACDDGNTVTETSCPYGQASCTACNATCTAVLNLTGDVPSDCPSTTLNWSQSQPAWNGNTSTAGNYSCHGNVPAASHGDIVSATLTSSDRTGSAQYICSDGSWVLRSGSSCNGKIITTTSASGISTTCSDTDAVRRMWISWYLADLKRCPAPAGLEWWTYQYNNNTDCLATDNYHGYGSKDACFRAAFREVANTNGNSYSEAQAIGHISSWDEAYLCGSLAYPWTSVSSLGTKCKYRP